MGDIIDYPSRLSDPQSRKYETFSYLPKMTDEQIRAQVKFIASHGWNPAIEHTEPENAGHYYWYMWKLPMFGESDVDRIIDEARICHEQNPNHHVRLIGYDNYTQSQGAAMVIFHAPSAT